MQVFYAISVFCFAVAIDACFFKFQFYATKLKFSSSLAAKYDLDFKGNSIDFDGLKGLFKKFFQKVDLGDLSISDLKSLAGRLATLLKDSNINVQSLSIDELKQYIKSADFSKCDSPTDLQNFISKKNSDLKNVKDIDDFRDGCSDQLNDMAKAEQSQTGKAGGGSKAGKGSKSGGSSSSSSSG